MPHDRDGKVLHVGDEVIVPARVKDVQAGEEYCNVSLETTEPMWPGESPSTLTLNAKQCVRVGPRSPTAAEPETSEEAPAEV